MADALVTGCGGFIGSRLTDQLLARGERVVGVDAFDDYYEPAAKRRNLLGARNSPRFQLVEGDVRNLPLETLLEPGTTVYHLAARPGVRPSWGVQFRSYLDHNLLATQAVLEARSRVGGQGRFVYASSSSIYGQAAAGPTPEDAPTAPLSPYGLTKLAGEHLVRAYARSRGFPATSLRFFTVYGPRQRPDMAFHRFFRAAQAREPIEVYGTGAQLRDFTYVDDIVGGIVAAGERDTQSDAFNLGGGTPTKLEEAIRTIGQLVGAELAVRHLPTQPGDPESTWADTSRAVRELRYAPRVPLAEGLDHEWEWFIGERAHVSLAA